MVNEKKLQKLKNIWLLGKLEMHKTLYDLDPNVNKPKKVQKKTKNKKFGYRSQERKSKPIYYNTE